jgi:GH25 family lysozyme M1 (1,4-beta-N-acetylmuramidase)
VTGVDDAWRHDELGWFSHSPGVDDQQLTETEALPYVPVAPLASGNALGIDTASYQGSPAWAQVAATRQFVYVKAGQGNGTSYPTLDAQYQGAMAAGMAVGLYWFADPSLTPEANADAFSVQVNRLGAIQGHLPPCLDLETGTGYLGGWAQQFVARLRQNTGCVRVMIYSSASFMKTQITETWMDANIALWVASWGVPPGQPTYTSPRVALHQYSSTGAVAGVAGAVDLDWAVWDLATLIPTAQGGTPVATPPSAPVTSLTADQVNAILGFLTALYQQGSGSVTLGSWTGWPSWPKGSGRSLTPVDYLRQADEQLCAIKAELDSLKAQAGITPGATPSALSDADISKIAAAVAGMLASKLSKP